MKVDNIGLGLKAASKFIGLQEGGAGLSHIKFIQDSATGLVPKALFSRSKADLLENSFLELSESALVYYGPGLLGEGIFRKLYGRKLTPELSKKISTPATELLKNNSAANKTLMPIKAAISLSCLLIPLTEFTLNYFKNLLTLKMFKQGDFTDIAKLDKKKKVNTKDNEKVENSAKKNIARAAVAFAGCLAASALLCKKGQNSKVLQNFSELVLAPGTKLFKNPKLKDFANKYFSLDFANNNGKLTMSKGQLTSCVLIGAAGYFGAAKDRGKQNFLEVLFRFPLVGFYTICGSELLEKGFKKILMKAGKCKETLGKNLEVPLLKDLPELAKKLQKEKGGNYNEIYKKLLKQKTLISGVPLLFGIGVMGFFVAGVSRFFTQYRYDKENKDVMQLSHDIPAVFKSFVE